jgi:hypothetical protein
MLIPLLLINFLPQPPKSGGQAYAKVLCGVKRIKRKVAKAQGRKGFFELNTFLFFFACSSSFAVKKVYISKLHKENTKGGYYAENRDYQHRSKI